jgi:hypothetical protein
MEFNDKDFNKLTYKVHEHDRDADFFKLFPVFARYPVFTRYEELGVNIGYMMRYIIYCFDKNSPLSSIENVFERRVKAATLAGFSMKNDKFPKRVEDILLSRNFKANCMIIQYCIMHAGEEYTTFVTFQEALRKQLENLMAEDEDVGDKKKDIIANVQKLREDLRSTRDMIFKFEEDTFLTKDLYSFLETRKLKISPEDWAVMLNEKEIVINVAKSVHQIEEELQSEVDEEPITR